MATTSAPSYPRKRQRTGNHQSAEKGKEEEDGYRPGNIVEIELHNFMTYDHIVCQPAPRLNLVVGPNGSGKSSLVCAIALGLAGDPQILGRASSIGAFVKRGEDSGYIKISLREDTPSERIIITRKISSDNKSEWLLNGVGVSKRDVVEVIQKFNIQVNNLTQFLPQDRVCEFAKLTPTQLLEETEKAVGDPELYGQHTFLIERSRELKKLELTVKQNGDSLDQLETLNAEQERDVGRVRKREELLSKVELMKKKLPWLRYDLKKMEYMEAQRTEKEAKRKLDEAAKILNNLSAPLEEKKQVKRDQEATCKKINNQISQNTKKRMEAVDLEGHMCVQVRAKYTEMEELRKLEASKQLRIAQATEDLVTAEAELANLPVYDPPRSEIENLNTQIMDFEVSANQRKLEITEKEDLLFQKKRSLRQCIDRLKDSENKQTKLLQALRKSGADKICEAFEWLQAHRGQLRKEVYGPILIEVNVKDRTHATYLENHIPYYIWKSFVTQDPVDRDFLVNHLKSFGIPVLNYVRDGPFKKTPFEVPHEMRKLGIYTRLDQVFDAPDAVHEILTSQSSISSSFVGTHETDRRADELVNLGVLDFWTPESHYRWSISRYGGHVSASVEPIRPSRLFLCSSDVGDVENTRIRSKELEEAIADLEECLKSMKFEQRQLDDSAAKLHKEREEIINTSRFEKKKRRDMENLIEQRRRKIMSLKNEEDLESNIKRLVDQVVSCNSRRFQTAIQIKNLLLEAVSYKWRLAQYSMTLIEIDCKIAEVESELKQHQRTAMQASTHFAQCKEETENCRQQLSSAKILAESVAVITKELSQKFLKMPTTIEELQAAIQDNISQANSILFVNQNILEEYEARQSKIDVLKAKLDIDRKELKKCLSEIEALKESWLPTLRSLVARINEIFSRNFQEMAVAGEVSLDEHELDFDKFGILIKVKFRQGSQLQVLSAHHQSGGERSVSTILYLVSLQDLTNCPFRVVDEINQGMDPQNERKMFQQLVKAASQISTPQCFLLTPKLLDNLEYTEACSILNIMNGPWIKEAAEGTFSFGNEGTVGEESVAKTISVRNVRIQNRYAVLGTRLQEDTYL